MEAEDFRQHFLGIREMSTPAFTKKCSPEDLSVKIRGLLLLVRLLSNALTPNGKICFLVYRLTLGHRTRYNTFNCF